MAMREWLLWSNCTNQCEFCWQCKRPNPDTFLNKDEMLDSIKCCKHMIEQVVDYDDVLLVGGEAYCVYSPQQKQSMIDLFKLIYDKVVKNEIRYFYVNTNLIYDDISIIDEMLKMFDGYRDRIKFTTSYDIYGRFTPSSVTKWRENIKRIKSTYPDVNIVANIILTNQACESIIKGEFDLDKFKEEYKLKYINLLPYIALPNNNDMFAKFSKIIHTLEIAESVFPGYLNFYYHDYNDNQDKVLYEYRKDVKEYVECTAKYGQCGHNVNFRKATDDGSCYICNLFDYLESRCEK